MKTSDPRTVKMAQILVQHSAHIEPGDRVALEATTAAEPLVRELYREILKQGGHPHLLLSIPEENRELFSYASDDQLSYVDPIRHFVYKQFESRIRIHSLTDTKGLEGFPPAKQTLFQKSHSPILATQMERGAKEEFKWVTTLFPTPAYAAEAGMALEEYENFVYQACYADRDDPVVLWNSFKTRQAEAIRHIESRDQVVLSGPDIDLRLSIKDRVFKNSYGRHNMPDGEIFTGPVEDTAQGWVRFAYPAIYNGVVVKGIELTFKDGKVVKASAEENEEVLLQLLDSDDGSRYIGEFAIGTNHEINRFTGNILFDEKIGGTIHIALGAGYPETGSLNKSMIHWDMICDMRTDSEITVDNELIYRDGQFQLS